MTVLAEPILTTEVADQYEVVEPTEVRAFVAARSHLASLLAEAPEKIALFFPGAPLRLEVHVDPEDGTETLLIRIRTNMETPAVIERLDALTEAWYLDLPYESRRDAIVILGEL
jgi:hypothetical protein